MCQSKVCFILRSHVWDVTGIKFPLLFVYSGRQDLLMPENFLLLLPKRKALLATKVLMPFNLFPSVSWIWITKTDFLLSGFAMVSCILSCGTQLVARGSLVFFVLFCFKFSRIVIYRSKFRRMGCTLNWSYIVSTMEDYSVTQNTFWFRTRVR